MVSVSSSTNSIPNTNLVVGTSTPYSTQYQNPVSLVVYLQ